MEEKWACFYSCIVKKGTESDLIHTAYAEHAQEVLVRMKPRPSNILSTGLDPCPPHLFEGIHV